jgi:hypothetical protein
MSTEQIIINKLLLKLLLKLPRLQREKISKSDCRGHYKAAYPSLVCSRTQEKTSLANKSKKFGF